jgi:hypothetical protein
MLSSIFILVFSTIKATEPILFALDPLLNFMVFSVFFLANMVIDVPFVFLFPIYFPNKEISV